MRSLIDISIENSVTLTQFKNMKLYFRICQYSDIIMLTVNIKIYFYKIYYQRYLN